MTDKLIMTTALRDGFIQALLGDGDTKEAIAMLQSLPVVSAEPFAYYLKERDNVDFIYAHEYSNHEDRMHERGGEVIPLYTSPQALAPITADDVTDEMVEAVEDDVSMGADAWDCIDPKELIASIHNIIFKHRSEAR